VHRVIGTEPGAPHDAAHGAAVRTAACRNCGDTTDARYCPACGQRRDVEHLSLRTLAARLADEAISLNGKLPRSLLPLLFRPGFLTCEYVAGRIARYVRPLRLYLVFSVVFFLILSLSGAFTVNRTIGFGDESPMAADASAAPAADAGTGGGAAPAERRHWTDAVYVTTGSPQIQALVDARKQRFSTMEPNEAVQAVLRDFREHVPIAMFFLLPAFALMLKLLYVRSGRYYVEHLVFALHAHAFVYILFSVMLLARTGWVLAVLGFWMPIYLWWAMRTVYAQGWLKTSFKFALLGSSYLVLLAATLVGALVVSVLLV
jgi:hypothetical protein